MPAVDNSAACSARTAADDAALETASLFKGKGGTRIWNETQWLFATDAVQEVKLLLSTTNWNYLRSDPGREVFTSGDVVIGGETVSNIGMRFKGFYGSLRICLIGWIQCEKLSWKLKFNHYNKSQRFYGLKRLQLHASIHDQTLMRERLTYSLWREMGVPAPRQSYVNVIVVLDGTTSLSLGIHILTEQIDGRFTETFKSGDGGDGNLYKEAWPGTGTVNADTFKNALRTNNGQGDTPNVQRLVDFSNAMAGATNDYDLAMQTKQYMKAKEAAKYWAVDRAVQHWDGPINFRQAGDSNCEEKDYPIPGIWNEDDDCCTTAGRARCKNGNTPVWETKSCGQGPGWVAYYYRCSDAQTYWNHNFYIYQEDETDANQQEFRMVGWDVDSTWLKSSELSYHLGGAKDWDTPVGTCSTCQQCETYGTGSGLQFTAACFQTVRVWARGLRTLYMNAAEELIAGPLQLCRLKAKINRWKAALQSYIAADIEGQRFPATSVCYQQSFDYDATVTYFRDTVVPDYVTKFKDSVTCSRSYDADGWDQVINTQLAPMLRLNTWQTGAWSPVWLNGGTCASTSVGYVITPTLSVLAVMLVVGMM
jgi:hypothetical protein